MAFDRKITALFICLFLMCCRAVAQDIRVDFLIKGVTAEHLSQGVFLAGSINGWQPNGNDYRFSSDAHLTLHLKSGSRIEYKLTRGSWDQAECQTSGAQLANRQLTVPAADTTILLEVEAWADAFTGTAQSTATANVQPLRDSVFFPYGNRYVTIRVYLPQEAIQNSKRRFPLLLMTDGQNIFDTRTAYAGEWGVDESLDSMQASLVVAGIDHAGSDRLKEYSVGSHPITGVGYGEKWLQWLSDSVLPYLRKHYPVTRQRENTWIAGSSMGGLISSWAMLLQAGSFGGAGIFSPSYQLADTFFHKKPVVHSSPPINVWWYAGGAEADWMLPVTERVYEAFTGHAQATSYTSDVLGRHEEAAWRYRFPAFVLFMKRWLVAEPSLPDK